MQVDFAQFSVFAQIGSDVNAIRPCVVCVPTYYLSKCARALSGLQTNLMQCAENSLSISLPIRLYRGKTLIEHEKPDVCSGYVVHYSLYY